MLKKYHSICVRQITGFTLVETMIVMAILGALAALSMTMFLNGRINTNETLIQKSLQALSASLEDYRNSHQEGDYPEELSRLAESTEGPAFADGSLTGGETNGYQVTYTKMSAGKYQITATPKVNNVTGKKSFSIDDSGNLQSLS